MKSRSSALALALATVASSLAVSSLANAGAVTAGDRRLPPGFWVDFGSIGTGINTRAYEALNTAIAGAMADGSLREYKLIPYGREGERKVCFVFAEPASAWKVLVDMNAAGLMDDRMFIMSARDCAE